MRECNHACESQQTLLAATIAYQSQTSLHCQCTTVKMLPKACGLPCQPLSPTPNPPSPTEGQHSSVQEFLPVPVIILTEVCL